MGEFIDIGSSNVSFGVVSSVICTIAMAVFALMQPGQGDDDDSNGGGGGGLMQPIS